MRRKALILMSLILFTLLSRIAITEAIDYDDEFNRATSLKGSRSIDTDLLIKNTTEVLHKENMKTHAELEKLRKEIEELKREIERLKDIVESGG